jgi:hypothetical protein
MNSSVSRVTKRCSSVVAKRGQRVGRNGELSSRPSATEAVSSANAV